MTTPTAKPPRHACTDVVSCVNVEATPIPQKKSAPAVIGQASPPAATASRQVSPRNLLPNVLRDQKPIWWFPLKAARGDHWKATVPFIAATAALVELDPHDTPYFRRTRRFEEFNEDFSSVNTGIALGLLPLGFYVIGSARGSSSSKHTALLASEALLDAEIVAEVMKNIDRRLRPRELPANGDFAHTWFKAGDGLLVGRGSFPSGHAIGAFAMATVFAQRCHKHRWVPWLAYGLASAVGMSRVTVQAHFPSDIFAGAVLAGVIGHFVVLRRRSRFLCVLPKPSTSPVSLSLASLPGCALFPAQGVSARRL